METSGSLSNAMIVMLNRFQELSPGLQIWNFYHFHFFTKVTSVKKYILFSLSYST